MKVQRNDVNGVAVVSVDEPVEIDLGNAQEFKSSIKEAIADENTVVLDAARVEFFDSAGMATLLSLHKQLRGRDGRLVLAGLNPTILEVFGMIGFDVVFEIHSDVADAIAALKGDAS